MVGLEPRGYAERRRMGSEQRLSLLRRHPDEQGRGVEDARDQPVVDVLGGVPGMPLALDPGQRFGERAARETLGDGC